MRTRALLPLLLAALAPHLPAQRAVDAELRKRFGFLGPRVKKLTWGITLLRVARLDGPDAPAVAILHNPRRGRIDVVRAGEDELTVESIPTRTELRGLAVADANGDGTLDLVHVDIRGRLAVRLRGSDPRELPDIDVGLPAVHDCLRAGDLDGDGKADAVVVTEGGLRRVTELAGTPRVTVADPVQSKSLHGVELYDVSGDGMLDVVLHAADEALPVLVQQGGAGGSFGPWLAFDVPKLRALWRGTGAAPQPTLAVIEGAHGRVAEYALRVSDDSVRPALHLTTLPALKGTGARPFAHGDLDGDGDQDLVLADPERALLYFLLEERGALRVMTAPTFSGVDSLALGDVDGDGKTDILLTSSEEGVLAIKRGARPLDAFPEKLPAKDLPLLVAAGRGEDRSVYFIARTERRQATAYRLAPQEGGGFTAPVPLAELGRMTGNPLRLHVADLDGRFGPDLAFVEPGEGVRVVLATAEGKWHAPEVDAAARFTRGSDDGTLALVEEAGEPALLVVRDRFARVFRFDAAAQAVILRQDNGPEGVARMTLGAAGKDGARFFFDRDAGKLYAAPRDGATRSFDVPRLGATHMVAHQDGVLLIATQGVVRVPLKGSSHELARLRVHEPPDEKTRYYAGLACDLDGDGTRELAVADEHLHGIHVLVAREKALAAGLVFPVFEQTQDTRGSREPRDLAAGDLDGDGREDLVLVCHDRILVYLQEK